MNVDYDKWYRALKAVEPDAYKKAVEYAQGVSLNHQLPLKVSADIEIASVMLACELLGIRP